MTQQQAREMAKAYDPRATEDRVYEFWETRGYFKAARDRRRAKQPFCIIMPPPNVTGELHIGHALTDTVEDILIRWHRMLGDPTLWVPGVDHAGIATQNVVEKQLAKEGLTRHDLGPRRVREARLAVGAPLPPDHQQPAPAARRIGRLVAARSSRSTTTPQRAVRTTFKKMFDDGLIYRGERLINWCPRCRTALSDLEVEHEEQQGSLWYIRYPVVDGTDADGTPHLDGEHITVATTRPGDVRRRRRGRREPEGRALRELDRPHGDAAGDPARDPGRRRRGDRDGVRHRRREGDARPRPDRLRDRPAARPADHQRHEPRRDDERAGGAVRRHGPLRGARRRSCATWRSWATSRRRSRTRCTIGALLALPHRRRAADVVAVVREA